MRSALVAAALAALLAGPAFAKTKLCRDFTDYKAALAHFQDLKAQGLAGWKNMDRDQDGIPCESLPGAPAVAAVRAPARPAPAARPAAAPAAPEAAARGQPRRAPI